MTAGTAGAAAQAAADVVFVARRALEVSTARERLDVDVIHGFMEILRPDVYRVPGG